jgi:hypothetical protein
VYFEERVGLRKGQNSGRIDSWFSSHDESKMLPETDHGVTDGSYGLWCMRKKQVLMQYRSKTEDRELRKGE